MNPPPNVQPSPRIPKATLLELYRTLAGVQTMWALDAAPAVPGRAPGLEAARIWLAITSYGSKFVDEQRTRWDDSAQANRYLLVGQRQLTVSMRAESLDATLEPFDLCERVRLRLRTPTARAIFTKANLSLRDVQPISSFGQPGPNSPRMMKVAIMDVRWNYVVTAETLDAEADGTIETVNGGTPGPIPGRLE